MTLQNQWSYKFEKNSPIANAVLCCISVEWLTVGHLPLVVVIAVVAAPAEKDVDKAAFDKETMHSSESSVTTKESYTNAIPDGKKLGRSGRFCLQFPILLHQTLGIRDAFDLGS